MVIRSSMPPYDEYIQEIRPLWDTHWLTNMGEKHMCLEKELREYLGVKNVALFANGHLALEGIIDVFELKGEVITTPFTFASTTNAIVRKGLKPVFCDIREDDFTIDADKLETLITPETCAIMPVHVYGNVCDVEKIKAIADRHGLKVIYDAAHAFGVEKDDVPVGRFGDASMMSFHATKVFNTIEGGAALLNSDDIYVEINKWKNFGITGEESVEYVGGNAKMNEFCAAMGICNLRHISEALSSRKTIVEKYRELLCDIDGIQLNAIQKGVKSNYAYFPIVVDPERYGCTRDELAEKLAQNNIYARKYFYPLTNTFECYSGMFDPNDTPLALRVSKRVLTLPLYEELELEDVERICKIIAR